MALVVKTSNPGWVNNLNVTPWMNDLDTKLRDFQFHVQEVSSIPTDLATI